MKGYGATFMILGPCRDHYKRGVWYGWRGEIESFLLRESFAMISMKQLGFLAIFKSVQKSQTIDIELK